MPLLAAPHKMPQKKPKENRPMSRLTTFVLTVGVLAMSIGATVAADKPAALNFTMKSLGGKEVDLSKFQGKVVMIVNVASKCGLTPQYKQLQALHEKYEKDGLVILGFPCNQFLSQEPGTAEDIQKFCTVNYGVTFPLFAKIDVNGDGACPLYKHLTALVTKPTGAGKISWNFEKFVIGRNGEVVARFSPRTSPDAAEVVKVIEAELAKK
jgi:glutathione peroxidase